MPSDFECIESTIRGASDRFSAWRRELILAGLIAPPEGETSGPMRRLMDALDAFPGLVGYLNGRRGAGGVTKVENEADVQDLLYLSLKPIFPEMVYEQPSEKGAAGFSIGDFLIPSLKLILEAKFVGQKSDVKARADEIAEDIWKYTTQTDCERVIFFVYDPKLLIPDRPNYTRSLSASTTDFRSRGREVEIRTVVKP